MDTEQRIVPRLRIPAGDHGIIGAARFYCDAFRPLEEAGLDLEARGIQTAATSGDGVEITVAGFRIGLSDSADSADSADTAAQDGTAPAVMTPATNFTVNFDPLFFGWTRENASEGGASAAHARARAALDTVWDALADGSAADSAQTGLAPAALMPLDEYPFSPRYGWIQDCYGVSWQLMLTDPTGEPRPPIMPSFLFGGEAQNRAGEALDTWISVFTEAFGERDGRDSRDGALTSTTTSAGLTTGTGTGTRVDYPEQSGPAPQGAVLFSDLQLAGTWFTAMDSGAEQPFTFTDAVRYEILCDTPFQAEALRRQLTGPRGTDSFGVTWVPRYLG